MAQKSFKEWEKGMRAPAVTKSYFDRLTSDNLSSGDKLKHMLDPQQVFFKDIPMTEKEKKVDAAKLQKSINKQKTKRLAKSRAMGAGYKKGGKVKMACGGKTHKMKKGGKVTCRGMGCATRGGLYNKDG